MRSRSSRSDFGAKGHAAGSAAACALALGMSIGCGSGSNATGASTEPARGGAGGDSSPGAGSGGASGSGAGAGAARAGGPDQAGSGGTVGGESGSTGGSAAAAGSGPTGPCPALLTGPAPPITLDATLQCRLYYGLTLAPTSTPDVVYAGLGLVSTVAVARIAPDGVVLDDTGLTGYGIARVDADDSLWVVARSKEGDALVLASPAEPTWSHDAIPESADLSPADAIAGSDGLPRVLTEKSVPYHFYGVAIQTRTAPGVWSETQVVDPSYTTDHAAIAEDSLGRTRVVYRYYDSAAFDEWVDGNLVGNYPPNSVNLKDLSIAPGPSGTLGVATITPEGIGITVSDGESASAPHFIDGTIPISQSRCAVPDSCEPGTCIIDGSTSYALAATGDGAFWVAYVLRHIEYDFTVTMDPGASCKTQSTDDRSTQEVVLARLASDGSLTPSTRWSSSLPTQTWPDVTLVGRGTRLYLGLSDENATRLLGFDSSSL